MSADVKKEKVFTRPFLQVMGEYATVAIRKKLPEELHECLDDLLIIFGAQLMYADKEDIPEQMSQVTAQSVANVSHLMQEAGIPFYGPEMVHIVEYATGKAVGVSA
ncbi:MAG: hypothetical protein HN916_18375 [Anaerolineae bacterium]|jgi:hypothetical protein|nr:hypothetical protein [Anaerolineae bacterium]MBT7991046.1 hypothetical protein [Anaerolineae bacterium]